MDWPNHEPVWREWRSALAGERLHHGWIFAGKVGLGKKEFAVAAARELVNEPGIPQPEGDHPDILYLTHLPKDDKEERKKEKGEAYETKRNISVAQIREMQARLATRPTLGSRRVVLIEPADDLEKSASNALLKSLEEPPQGTFFILISHRPARLLPTIRSRCRVVRFPQIKPEALEAMLRIHAPDVGAAEINTAIAHSGGSPGAAIAFIEEKLEKIAAIYNQILATGDANLELRSALVKTVGQRPSRNRIQAILALAQSSLAAHIKSAPDAASNKAIDAHHQLGVLAAQAPTYNFDSGLLLMETGGLLDKAARGSD